MHHFMLKRMAFAVLIPALVAACGANSQGAAPGGKGPAAGPGAGAPPPPEVEVVTVGRATVPQTDELPGRLEAVRTADVRARVEGIVEKRVFREGSEVRAGDVLFQIDPRTLAANVQSAEAALAKAKADAAVTKETFARYQALLPDKAVSRQEYDQALARFKQSEADVAFAQAALTKARIDLGHATVRAPISGNAGRALVTEGALVGRGEATLLATVQQLDPIRVSFSQPSVEFQKLRAALRAGRADTAQTVPIRLLTEDGREYPRPGRLLFREMSVDPATGAVAQRAEFPNPDRDLLPGQFVRVRLPVAQMKDAITVPQRAVQASAEGQLVLVVGPDGKVAPRPVKTGGLSGGDWIITSGLNGGEQVVVEGLQKARPGSTVKPVPWKGASAALAPTAPPAPAPAAAAGTTVKPAVPAPAQPAVGR